MSKHWREHFEKVMLEYVPDTLPSFNAVAELAAIVCARIDVYDKLDALDTKPTVIPFETAVAAFKEHATVINALLLLLAKAYKKHNQSLETTFDYDVLIERAAATIKLVNQKTGLSYDVKIMSDKNPNQEVPTLWSKSNLPSVN